MKARWALDFEPTTRQSLNKQFTKVTPERSQARKMTLSNAEWEMVAAVNRVLSIMESVTSNPGGFRSTFMFAANAWQIGSSSEKADGSIRVTVWASLFASVSKMVRTDLAMLLIYQKAVANKRHSF
jgi:hypothetical protein